jgi:hypothetical protein
VCEFRPFDAIAPPGHAAEKYYVKRGRGSDFGFLTALLTDVLNRGPNTTEADVYPIALETGWSRTQLATTILFSEEGERYLVQSMYHRFLHRDADAMALAAFVAAREHGMGMAERAVQPDFDRRRGVQEGASVGVAKLNPHLDGLTAQNCLESPCR